MFLYVLSELFLLMRVKFELFQKIQILASSTAYFVNFDGYCQVNIFYVQQNYYTVFSANKVTAQQVN